MERLGAAASSESRAKALALPGRCRASSWAVLGSSPTLEEPLLHWCLLRSSSKSIAATLGEKK